MAGSARLTASADEVTDLAHHHLRTELGLGGQGEDVERRLPVIEGQGLPTQEERGSRPLGQGSQALVGTARSLLLQQTAGVAQGGQRVGLFSCAQRAVECRGQVGGIGVGDWGRHGQDRWDPSRQQLAGYPRQRSFTGPTTQFRLRGRTAREHQQGYAAVGWEHLGSEASGVYEVDSPLVVFQHQKTGAGMARQVQDMEPLQSERLA